MPSVAHSKFLQQISGARIIESFCDKPSTATSDQAEIQQVCLLAAVAQSVGCWEGYIEAVIREFVSKTRVMAQRRSWPLIVQFEALVDKLASELNTPSWEKARELFIVVCGADPHSIWIWSPRFSNSTDTKLFFDGVMRVRHAFAHGFNIPADVPGLAIPGKLDVTYTTEVLDCIMFFAQATDNLLENELKVRHACASGWN
jgi:hypothetical protein